MKNKIKYWISSIGILGVLLGRILNRILENYYGNNTSNIIVVASVAIGICVILLSIAIRQYFIAIMLFVMEIPLAIVGIGLYLNNMYITDIGILSIFIIYPILIKVIPKIRRVDK